jgi:hypothetical protein
MATYIAAFGFMVIGFSFMALTLHFAQYKKNGRCCSDGIDFDGQPEDECSTCPRRDAESCSIDLT